MSDYDGCTNQEISDELENIRRNLIIKGFLHAGEDAVMIQATKRLTRKD
jgi:hypothetical protein